MITRQQYIAAIHDDDEARYAAFRSYYAQLVDGHTIAIVVGSIGADRLLASTDKYLNDIPLEAWDDLRPRLAISFRALGDYPTLAGWVCVAKEAACQWIEQQS